MRGLYRATGDLGLLMRLGTLFKPAAAVDVDAPAGQRPAGPLALSGTGWMALIFVPTTLFWLLFNAPGVSPWIGAGLPLALALAITGYRLVFNRPAWLEGGVCLMLALFAALAAVGVPAIARWGGAFGSLFMGGIWLSSLLFNDLPVTAEYGRWGFARRMWHLSLFIHPNAVLTLVWGWQFLAAGALGVAAVLLPALHLPLVLAQYLLIVPAATFTKRYQAGIRERAVPDFERAMAQVRLAAAAGLCLCLVAIVGVWGWL